MVKDKQDDKGRRALGRVRVCMCLGVVAGWLNGRRGFTINLGSEGWFLSSLVEARLWSGLAR